MVAAPTSGRRPTSTRSTTRRCRPSVRSVSTRSGRIRMALQYQEELPVQRPLVHAFHVDIGGARSATRASKPPSAANVPCARCGRGAADPTRRVRRAAQQAVRSALWQNRSAAARPIRAHRHARRVVQAMHRAARQTQPTYDGLCATVRGSPVVTVDETSWRVDADLQWLWAYVTAATTVYAIQPGRGLAQAAPVMGLDYPGMLQRDGWQSYRRFTAAQHQSCLAHLLRRCRTLLVLSPPALRRCGQSDAAGRSRDTGGLPSRRRLDAPARLPAATTPSGSAGCWNARPVAARPITAFNTPHRRIQRHLQFSLRPDSRRHQLARRTRAPPRGRHPQNGGGGNRTARGAHTQQVLASVLRTADQRRPHRSPRHAAHRAHPHRPTEPPHVPRDTLTRQTQTADAPCRNGKLD